MKNKTLFLLINSSLWLVAVGAAHAQGTAFTYQGRLSDNGGTTGGIYDLRFTIYDLAGGGSAIAGPLTNAGVAVANGLFTTALDFGAAAFPGTARWLEIGVRTNGSSGDFTMLTPRQPITPTPYALFAGKAAMLAENASQIFNGTVGFNPSTPGAPPFAVSSSNKVNNLNADLFDGLDSTNFLLKSEHCLTNLAELKARAAGFVPCVTVLGYDAPGDGGGGSFYWDGAAIEAGNSGTVFVPDSNPSRGRWRRLVKDALSVRWFGAKGDGSTDDSAAIQATFDALPSLGGVVWFHSGRYLLKTSVIVTGTKHLEVRGYGAEIQTSGAIYGLIVRNSGDTVWPIVIAGLTVNQRLNTDALGAILVEQSWNVRLRDITVITDGSSPNYIGAIVVQGSDPNNNDTGSFWTRIENVWIGKLSSTDNPGGPGSVNGGWIPAGILLRDSANATTISGGGINQCKDAVLITTRLPNQMSIDAVLVDGVAFEICERAVTIDGRGSDTGGGSGIRITGCRGERLDTFLLITNRTLPFDFAGPPTLFGNYLVSISVTNYIVKPPGITTLSFDFMFTPDTGVISIPRGLALNQYFCCEHALTVNVGALSNRGLQVNASSTSETNDVFNVSANQVVDGVHGRINYALVGSAQYGIPRISHVGVRGLSASSKESHNLRGSVTLSGVMKSKPVSFGTAEADASYHLVASASATTGTPAVEATRVRTSDKTATGFAVHLETEPGDGNSVTVDWVLIR